MMVGEHYISPGVVITLGPIVLGLALAAVLTIIGAWKER